MSNGKQIIIQGNVLLLIGPLGSFFGRFAKFLTQNNVKVHKVVFPFWEFLIPKACHKHPFSDHISDFPSFLNDIITKHQIKHIFMNGNFILHHRVAIEEAKKLGIDAFIFELGYVRPNYVTLEKDNVNCCSAELMKNLEYYQNLPDVESISLSNTNMTREYHKVFKVPAFIQRSFKRYKITDRSHISQPEPKFLWFQVKGYLRYYYYQLSERNIKQRIQKLQSAFLIVLQVDIDSQLYFGSSYPDMEAFILEVIASFSKYAGPDDKLIFKHHPCDRGYNNYGKILRALEDKHHLKNRIYYVHDMPLDVLLKTVKGAVTINSTVGLQCLKLRVPLKVMGEAYYNLQGLSFQKSLNYFWKAAEFENIDDALFRKLYQRVINNTQMPGSFHGKFNFEDSFTIDNCSV